MLNMLLFMLCVTVFMFCPMIVFVCTDNSCENTFVCVRAIIMADM